MQIRKWSSKEERWKKKQVHLPWAPLRTAPSCRRRCLYAPRRPEAVAGARGRDRRYCECLLDWSTRGPPGSADDHDCHLACSPTRSTFGSPPSLQTPLYPSVASCLLAPSRLSLLSSCTRRKVCKQEWIMSGVLHGNDLFIGFNTIC